MAALYITNLKHEAEIKFLVSRFWHFTIVHLK